MTDFQIILIVVFVVSMIVGYFLINHVPSLLHTPLMSGMNALSGITVLGALSATALAIQNSHSWIGYLFGSAAIISAMINVVGGFSITHRMLKMFNRKDKRHE
ncbi:MAG: NAD(P) transhydrogenase subunit alpha [Bacilli bacterium]|jgi:NAD(P) transhydrogenase subunit alpha|nr:NAD(P) transhydrogenase subunit alpha [Bacilli bacterium]